MKTARVRLPAHAALFAALGMVFACAPARDDVPAAIVIVADPAPFPTVAAAASGEAKVDWWDGDRRDDAACTGSFAATELARFLPACLGLRAGAVRVAGRPPDDARAHRIMLRIVSESSGASPESYRLRALPSDPRLITIESPGAAGLLYGAYALLDTLGMRFFAPEAFGTIAPVSPASWPDSLDVRSTPAYATRGFWAWEARGDEAFFLWMARNRMNLWTAAEPDPHRLRKLGIRLTQGGHSVQHDLIDPRGEYPYRHARGGRPGAGPADPYPVAPGFRGDADRDGRLSRFEAHPEWFGLWNGARSDSIGTESGINFCTSNPHAEREFIARLAERLATGPWRTADVLHVWMLDDGRWCECGECAALGAPTDRLLRLLDHVLDGLDSARGTGALERPVEIRSLAFLETLAPPVRPVPARLARPDFAMTFFPIDRCYVHSLGDPACTEINAGILRSAQAWSAVSAATGLPLEMGEYYNLGEVKSLPLVLEAIAHDLPGYRELGFRHFHTMHAPTRLWGSWAYVHAMLARLLWDPAADPNAIDEDFFRRAFPKSGSAAREAFAELGRASGNFKMLLHRVRVGNRLYIMRKQVEAGVEPLLLDHMHRTHFAPARNDGPDLDDMVAAFARAREALRRAAAMGGAADERARLADVAARVEYGDAMVNFFDRLLAVDAFEREGNVAAARAQWPRLRAEAERLRGVRELVQVSSSHANARDGLAATGYEWRYRQMEERYGR